MKQNGVDRRARTQGILIVSDEDYDALSSYQWSPIGLYAATGIVVNGKRKRVRIHNFLMNPPKGYIVDHINGNKHDNRRENLRIATYAQNSANKCSGSKPRSGYRGVVSRGKRWAAQINFERKCHQLGTFDTPEEAHQAYCDAAKKLHGEFAYTETAKRESEAKWATIEWKKKQQESK